MSRRRSRPSSTTNILNSNGNGNGNADKDKNKDDNCSQIQDGNGTGNGNGKQKKQNQQKEQKQQQKLRNTSALLDQYQDDDDLTTNLLHAIRSWNLQRPPPEPETSTTCPGGQSNDNDCSSTINTMNSNSDLDTATANSAVTLTSSSSTVTITSATQNQIQNQHQYQHHRGLGHFNSMSGYSDGGGTGTGTATISSCGSTITSMTNMTNGSNATNGTNTTNASCNSSSSAVKKTPCRGNYSSRPSGLTARILLEKNDNDNDDSDNENDNEHDVNDNKYNKVGNDLINMSTQNKRNDERISGNTGENSRFSSESSNIEDNIHFQATQNERANENPTDENNPSLVSSAKTLSTLEPKHKHYHQQSNNSNSASTCSSRNPDINTDIDAMTTLQETALLLGLNPNGDLHKVLPTVKKLVRVVFTHVPNLEQFVDEVCNVVKVEEENEEKIFVGQNHHDSLYLDGGEGSGLESGMETDDCQDNNMSKRKQDALSLLSKKRKRRSRRQQRKKKTLLARKQKMDDTVRILRHGWQERSENGGSCKRPISATITTTSSSSSLPSSVPSTSQSQSAAPRRALGDMCDNCHMSRAKSTDSSSPISKKEESSFRTAVIEKLKHSQHCQGTQETYNDEQAMNIIENLICFEQKYIKVCGFQGKKDSFVSAVQSPPQSNSTIRDLFDADPTSLRQFVLHFAYLFSVQQDEIMSKMNDVYVFSHEAATMIDKIKKAMGLSPTCPIHSVTKKVVDFVEKFSEGLILESKSQSNSNLKPKPSSLAPNNNNLQQRNHHVRFNVVVEEFD
mmetsp:Transcript_7094/g.10810  ORF Transcript_7094/g.10810 Transcript_7094/m.10810 type:complete len:792 (+) Transcript_7094:929-3304(+)